MEEVVDLRGPLCSEDAATGGGTAHGAHIEGCELPSGIAQEDRLLPVHTGISHIYLRHEILHTAPQDLGGESQSVDADIQKGAARQGRIVEPRNAPGVKTDLSLYACDLSDLTARTQLPQEPRTGHERRLEGLTAEKPPLLRHAQDLFPLTGVLREGFFHENMLPRLQGPLRPEIVVRVRCRHVDKLCLRVCQQFLVGAVGPLRPGLCGEGFRLFQASGSHGPELRLLQPGHRRGHAQGDSPGGQYPDLYGLHRHRLLIPIIARLFLFCNPCFVFFGRPLFSPPAVDTGMTVGYNEKASKDRACPRSSAG